MKTKQIGIFFLIIGILLGSSFGAFGLISVTAVEKNESNFSATEQSERVTLMSLDEDLTLIKSIDELSARLTPYVDITITAINNLDELNSYLTESLDEYFVLFGHSDKKGIAISDQEVTWNDLSTVITQNKDQIVIIPTCDSFSLYESNAQAIENVLSPFKGEIDYRFSVDFTTLALGAFLEEESLLINSVDTLTSNLEYLLLPEETLAVTETGTYTAPGKGKIYVYDVFAEFLLANSFILGSSFSTALTYAFLKIFGMGFTPLTFIVQLLCVAQNFQNFNNFFMFNLQLLFAEYVIDSKTVVNYQVTYEEFGWARFVFLGLSHSTTYYTFYGVRYVENGVTKQRYYNVRMICDLISLDQLCIYALGFSIGIFGTQLVTWQLTSSGIIYPSGGGGGGGKDTPF